MDTTDDKPKEELPDDDKVVFVPDEVYRDFHSALHQMEKTQEELRKIAERMPQTEN